MLTSNIGVLLPATARAATALYWPLLEPFGLTHPQCLVLLALEDGKAHSAGEIAQRLLLTAGTMSPILKRLEALAFIDRPRDTVDERRLAVSLTDTGPGLVPELRRICARIDALVGITPREQARIRAFIADLDARTDALDA